MRAPPIDPDALAALATPRVARWLFAASIDWIAIAVVFALVAWIDHPLAYVLAIVPLGSRQQALGALFHDAAHRLVTRRRGWNDLWGSLLAAWPLGLTLGGYRRYHFAHHEGLGTAKDPELTHKSLIDQWRLPASPRVVLGDFASDLAGGGLQHLVAAGTLTRPVSLRETLGIGTFWLAIFAVAWKLHVLWMPVLWIVSIATVFWSGVRLRLWTEHLGTTSTHRIAVPWWLAHLIMPHDIGLHWEHHHFPGVPFWNLARLRALLPGDLVPLPALARTFRVSSAMSPVAIDPRLRRLLVGARVAIHVVLPLLLGGLVTVLCRRVMPRVLVGFPFGGLFYGRLPARFVDVFPDAAWAYALTALLAIIWTGSRRTWLLAGPLAAAGWELGQGAHIFPGTYDILDLVFGVSASFVAIIACSSPPPTKDSSPCASTSAISPRPSS